MKVADLHDGQIELTLSLHVVEVFDEGSARRAPQYEFQEVLHRHCTLSLTRVSHERLTPTRKHYTIHMFFFFFKKKKRIATNVSVGHHTLLTYF